MRILGIDPGLTGGIAILGNNHEPAALKMPATERDVFDVLDQIGNVDFAYIEKVGAMPKQGIASTWQFGQGYGGLRMALIALVIPFEAVAPGVWQQTMKCRTGGDKNVSKRRAQELFPSLSITHATADALLIAAYGWQQVTGKPYVGRNGVTDAPA